MLLARFSTASTAAPDVFVLLLKHFERGRRELPEQDFAAAAVKVVVI